MNGQSKGTLCRYKECVHEINITRGFKGKNTDTNSQWRHGPQERQTNKQTVVITRKLLTFTTLDSWIMLEKDLSDWPQRKTILQKIEKQ